MDENIKQILTKNSVYSKDLENLLYKHLTLVVNFNKKQNLTRINDVEKGKLLHIEDSLIPIHYILCNFDQKSTKYADLGSGAGYPGLPLGITCNIQTSLIETTTKKARVLLDIINILKLENIKVINSRIEEVVKTGEKFNLLTARALSSLSSLLELASPICEIGGQLICYKSTKCNDEILQADKIEDIFGFKKILCKDFVLSDQETKRRIIVYKKISEASICLPRKLGMAQKRPYQNK